MERELLEPLVLGIERMVGAVTADQTIEGRELRRVLSFLAKVVQVVDQAFQDVLAVLIELKYLTVEDLKSGQVRDLRKQLDLVTARSRYRDAEEICSRLHHLTDRYRGEIEPIVAHLAEPGAWADVLGLINEYEGYIIVLVQRATEVLGQMLDGVTAETIGEVNQAAAERVEAIKASLGELRRLSSEIMGLSGRDGFLELTADRDALAARTTVVLERGAITMSDTFNMSGDFRGAILNIKSTLNGVTQTIGQMTSADEETKEALTALVDQLNEALQQAPPAQEEAAEAVAETAKALVEQAAADKPNKTMIRISGEGLKQAAQNVAAVMPTVVAIATQIVAAVGKYVG